MPVFKNENNGTWYVMARYVNWKGERKQKCKRGFATKKEAQEWERMFQLQNSSDMDMSFEAFGALFASFWLHTQSAIKNQKQGTTSVIKASAISDAENQELYDLQHGFLRNLSFILSKIISD